MSKIFFIIAILVIFIVSFLYNRYILHSTHTKRNEHTGTKRKLEHYETSYNLIIIDSNGNMGIKNVTPPSLSPIINDVNIVYLNYN